MAMECYIFNFLVYEFDCMQSKLGKLECVWGGGIERCMHMQEHKPSQNQAKK